MGLKLLQRGWGTRTQSPPGEDRARRQSESQKDGPHQHPDLGLPVSGTMREKVVLFMPLVYGMLLWQPEQVTAHVTKNEKAPVSSAGSTNEQGKRRLMQERSLERLCSKMRPPPPAHGMLFSAPLHAQRLNPDQAGALNTRCLPMLTREKTSQLTPKGGTHPPFSQLPTYPPPCTKMGESGTPRHISTTVFCSERLTDVSVRK